MIEEKAGHLVKLRDDPEEWADVRAITSLRFYKMMGSGERIAIVTVKDAGTLTVTGETGDEVLSVLRHLEDRVRAFK